ncbi:MAG: hypothetical protein GKR89_34955 [Candidatus Latescibacteria bacterium]|nr:hypothetical protein [Candidatus Latescibacterota bacterium]
MTTHQEHIRQHRQLMQEEGGQAIAELVAAHPEYAVDQDQSGSASVTNYVIFGRCGSQPAVFKYFCEDQRREREVYGLRHWADSGLVPALLGQQGRRLIVVERFPGAFLPSPQDQGWEGLDKETAGSTLGQATAKLCAVPLELEAAADFEARFYGGQGLKDYFAGIVEGGRQMQQKADAYADEIFARSLDLLESQLNYILAQPRILYHQDAANMHFVDSCFRGFFDLEMCRVGTRAMQLGSLWGVLAICRLGSHFARGMAAGGAALGARELEAGRAFAHFMVWRDIVRIGGWGADAGAPISREQADRFRCHLERCDSLRWEE